MVHPTRPSSAGEDRFSRILRAGANRIARGRCGMMAYVYCIVARSLPRHGHRRTGAGCDLGDYAGAHHALMIWWRQ